MGASTLGGLTFTGFQAEEILVGSLVSSIIFVLDGRFIS